MLENDWGIYAIGGIALVLVFQAIYQFYRGYRGKFMDKIDDHPDSRKEYEAVKKSGTFGYMARAVVFAILAFFLVKVITSHSAQAYKGTEGVWEFLLGLSYGPYLMGAVALGLLGYGIFCILVAKNSNMMRA